MSKCLTFELPRDTLNISFNALGCLSQVTDTGLDRIARLTQLHQPKLEFCLKITDMGPEHVTQLTQLICLTLDGYGLHDHGHRA